jgi:acetamidase/formamidase
MAASGNGSHFITMGIHEDLTEATKGALREMIDFW